MTNPRKFTKMHGLGNDYIYFDCLKEELPNPELLSPKLSDRHFGIGGDGIVLILPSSNADFKMRMFNADGSEAQMCGNAVRCVGKYLYERHVTKQTIIKLETKAGVKILNLNITNDQVDSVKVDLGEPIFTPAQVPVDSAYEVLNQKFELDGHALLVSCVSMGNPHAVFFVNKITDQLVLGLGPKIEKHPMFPERVNVEFVEVISPKILKMRVWERGSGETWACGTGAAAVAVIAAKTQRTENSVKIHLLGGDLELEWAENNHVYKTGPAKFVFDGLVDLEAL